ncbi:MAG TPA: ribose-5-phosphate isomerase RpiA, partial [Stellaceae bacterium]|nr:ribose-5-phosphate isomerase RpiA [Stellaceae bacterium]
AAERAVEEVEDGMVVGLGTGTTARFALLALARRMRQGLHITGIPTSEHTARAAHCLGLPLTDFSQSVQLDLAIDGADQVERGTLHLLKGRGGALLREKIVATASSRMIVIIDERKLVDHLGGEGSLSVEISPFGWQSVIAQLRFEGLAPKLRLAGADPFVTDGGHYLADCTPPEAAEPAALQTRLHAIPGVIECGLFLGLASTIWVGTSHGVERLSANSCRGAFRSAT